MNHECKYCSNLVATTTLVEWDVYKYLWYVQYLEIFTPVLTPAIGANFESTSPAGIVGISGMYA